MGSFIGTIVEGKSSVCWEEVKVLRGRLARLVCILVVIIKGTGRVAAVCLIL